MNNGIKTYNYTYDDVNNITSDNNKNYTYDDIYRIKQTTDTNTTTLLENFDYDNLGNRTTSYNQATGSGANYSYTKNNLNQYTALSGSILSYQLQEIIETTTSSGTTETGSGTTETGSGTTETGSGTTETGSGTTESGSGTTTGTGEITTTTITYTGSLVTTNENIDYLYDNNGNLKQDNKYKYYYDYKNRLVKATNLVDETIVEFAYDVLNRRYKKETVSKIVEYVYTNENILQEKATDKQTNVIVTKDYINGLGTDELVAYEENGNRYYYHINHLGSVVGISDNTGNTIVEYDYDVFGKSKVISGDANFENNRLYTGREYDTELGLYYNRARYYNPELARFISRDPIDIKDDVNLYAYVGNNGVMYKDLLGLGKTLIIGFTGHQQVYDRMFHLGIGEYYIPIELDKYPKGEVPKGQYVDNGISDLISKFEGNKGFDTKLYYGDTNEDTGVLPALNYIKENKNKYNKIIIVGHSLGGDNSVLLSNYLNDENINVDHLITLEIASPTMRDNVDKNVQKATNYYVNFGAKLDLSKDNNETEINNIEMDTLLGKDVTHKNIDDKMVIPIYDIIFNNN